MEAVQPVVAPPFSERPTVSYRKWRARNSGNLRAADETNNIEYLCRGQEGGGHLVSDIARYGIFQRSAGQHRAVYHGRYVRLLRRLTALCIGWMDGWMDCGFAISVHAFTRRLGAARLRFSRDDLPLHITMRVSCLHTIVTVLTEAMDCFMVLMVQVHTYEAELTAVVNKRGVVLL